MTDSSNEGSGPPRKGATGPLLSATDRPLTDSPDAANFREFMTYASRRRRQGPRQVPTPPPMPVPRLAVTEPGVLAARIGLLAGLSVFLVVGGLGLFFTMPQAPKQRPEPSWVRQSRGIVSAMIGLPRPSRPGEVPDRWAGLTLGDLRTHLDRERLTPLPAHEIWADASYCPDPARPDVVLGLSFHKDRLCKIVLHLGEESLERVEPLVHQGHAAYGPPKSYEYMTGTGTHLVAVFQTGERMLKLDGLKTDKGVRLTQVILMDCDAATQRELMRRPSR